jgi:multiple antibiotic resistance protein
MLLGPVKLIPVFAGLTRGADARFKRDVAIRAAVIASVLCVFVALAGGTLVGNYRVSIDALRIAGGLVLLIAGLQVIFQKTQPSRPNLLEPDQDHPEVNHRVQRCVEEGRLSEPVRGKHRHHNRLARPLFSLRGAEP